MTQDIRKRDGTWTLPPTNSRDALAARVIRPFVDELIAKGVLPDVDYKVVPGAESPAFWKPDPPMVFDPAMLPPLEWSNELAGKPIRMKWLWVTVTYGATSPHPVSVNWMGNAGGAAAYQKLNADVACGRSLENVRR